MSLAMAVETAAGDSAVSAVLVADPAEDSIENGLAIKSNEGSNVSLNSNVVESSGKRSMSGKSAIGISLIKTVPSPNMNNKNGTVQKANKSFNGVDIGVDNDDDIEQANISAISGVSTISALSTDDIDGSIDVSLSHKSFRSSSFVGNKPNNSNSTNLNKSQNSKQQISRFKSTPSLPTARSSMVSPYNPSVSTFHNSQVRLPRRQSYQHLTKKQKDKLYENDNDTYDNNDSEILMYNVPIASTTSLRMFQNGNALQSKEALRKAWNESDSNIIIPPSPLPGKLSENSKFDSHNNNNSMSNGNSNSNHNMNNGLTATSTDTNHKSQKRVISPAIKKNPVFNVLSPTAQQLSTFYEYSSKTQAKDELSRRKLQSTPSTVKNNELDDLSFASTEKLSKLTVTRPSWIPPKDEHELHKHEREFKKIIENQSRKALQLSKHQIKIKHDQVIGDGRLVHIAQKSGSLTNHNIAEIRKYILISTVDNNIKFSIFRKLLVYKLGADVLLSPKINSHGEEESTLLDLSNIVHEDSLTESQISSLRTILQPIVDDSSPNNSKNKSISKSNEDASSNKHKRKISKLADLNSLPLNDLLSRLIKISVSLLNCKYTTPQIKDIVFWCYKYIFDLKFKENYAKFLTKSSIHKLYKEFQDDYSILTFSTCLDLLLELNDKLVCKCLEMIIVFWSMGSHRGIRMFLAIITCIIREHHFGWNSLQAILQSKNTHVLISADEESTEKFFKWVMYYYDLIK